jgi:hypothetical protein
MYLSTVLPLTIFELASLYVCEKYYYVSAFQGHLICEFSRSFHLFVTHKKISYLTDRRYYVLNYYYTA